MREPCGMARLGDRVEHAIESRTDVEHEIERGTAEQPPRRRIVRTVIGLAVTGVSLYLVAPSVIDLFEQRGEIYSISPGWLAAMFGLTVASTVCLWALQRLALRARSWFAVITSQLAGNAMAKIAPGGGAIGAALQYRMLVQGGVDGGRATGALTAVSLLTFAVVLALPVVALPAIARGAVSRTLVEATIIGVLLFAVLAGVGAALLAFDGPLEWAGRMIQRVRNRMRPHSAPLTKLPERLLAERSRILSVLGPRWKRALLATAGRWAFDYATLLAALAAVGSHPRPVLVLLAFCAAQILSQVPITPGGLGFVEAGLSAMLVLAGVSAGDAAVATLAYRLFTYWLPLPAGLVGYALHRRRFGDPSPTVGEDGSPVKA